MVFVSCGFYYCKASINDIGVPFRRSYSLFTLYSPTGEGQLGSRDEKDNKDGNRIAQLESELKDMQDRLLNVSMQYAEVEAQREELVMELKSATARKGRWF